MRARLGLRAGHTFVAIRGVFLIVLALGACGGQRGRTSPIPKVPDVTSRPAEVPKTALWFTGGDSLFWYSEADSLALAQMRAVSPPERVSQVLYELRDLGWRMTVDRGPALQRPRESQSLNQTIFQLERVHRAKSPTRERHVFARRFWPDSQAVVSGLLMNILPGLRLHDTGRVEYFWPASVAVAFSPFTTQSVASGWLDSLGCTVTTSPQLVHQYYVERAWAVDLPAGADLFAWLRYFNADPRVQLAHPVVATREPPSPDARLVRRFGKRLAEPASWAKLSDDLKEAYEIAHFSNNPSYAESSVQIVVDRGRFKVEIFRASASAAEDSLLVSRYGGELLSRSPSRIEAWIPHDSISSIAADTLVERMAALR